MKLILFLKYHEISLWFFFNYYELFSFGNQKFENLLVIWKFGRFFLDFLWNNLGVEKSVKNLEKIWKTYRKIGEMDLKKSTGNQWKLDITDVSTKSEKF